MLTVLVSTISNSQFFFAEKCKSYSHFSAKILTYMPYLMIKVLMICKLTTLLFSNNWALVNCRNYWGIFKYNDIFASKVWVAFAVQKLHTFLQQKNINVFAIFQDRSFNIMLANNFVKFWTTEPCSSVFRVHIFDQLCFYELPILTCPHHSDNVKLGFS